MTTVEMTRNFKTKAGYTRVIMIEKYPGTIKYIRSLCYPAYQEGHFVEYTQDTYEMTKDEANNMYLKLKKQGYSATVTK